MLVLDAFLPRIPTASTQTATINRDGRDEDGNEDGNGTTFLTHIEKIKVARAVTANTENELGVGGAFLTTIVLELDGLFGQHDAQTQTVVGQSGPGNKKDSNRRNRGRVTSHNKKVQTISVAPAVGRGGSSSSLDRINYLFRKLFRVIVKHSSFVLFLDDVRWTDASSLVVLKYLGCDHNS